MRIRMRMKSTEEKRVTVGVKYAFIGARWLSLETLAPTKAATNTRPTALPTRFRRAHRNRASRA
jgi:hypothetical protein